MDFHPQPKCNIFLTLYLYIFMNYSLIKRVVRIELCLFGCFGGRFCDWDVTGAHLMLVMAVFLNLVREFVGVAGSLLLD